MSHAYYELQLDMCINLFVIVFCFFRECPLALEAINGLMSLGLKGSDVHSLVLNGLPSGASCDWFVLRVFLKISTALLPNF